MNVTSIIKKKISFIKNSKTHYYFRKMLFFSDIKLLTT